MTHKAEALLGFGLLNLTGKIRLGYLHNSEENNKVDKFFYECTDGMTLVLDTDCGILWYGQ